MMRMMLTVGAIAWAAGGAPARAQEVPAPMPPSGKWVANFADSMCLLSRDYAAGDTRVTLAFRPVPGDENVEMFLVMPHRGTTFFRAGKAEISLEPSGHSYSADLRDYTIKGGMRVVRTWPESGLLTELPEATSIEVTIRKKQRYRFALSATAAALRTIGTCQDQLMKAWGFDPESLRAQTAKATPVGSPQKWITDDDYPVSALRMGSSGMTRFYLRVTPEGGIGECVIAQSSGNPTLDQKACELIVKRAKFSPALDAEGKPTMGMYASTVRWQIPGW